jgi:excisionase family DNA binding protein
MKGEMVRGAVRRGEGLLAGLLRCRRCGRKLHVAYSGKGGNTARYHCCGAQLNHGVAGSCLAFGALRIDAAVSAEVARVLQPEGVAAALEQARFEAARARRQYDAVDPDNRLVAAELERRWNACLAEVARLEKALRAHDAVPAVQPPSEVERARLLALGADLDRVWNHPAASAQTRKQILRTLIHEILVDVVDDTLTVVIHWQGGDHTELRVKKNRGGQHRWVTERETQELIGELARLLPDGGIASLLNRLGKRTAKGLTWTEGRIRAWRGDHGVAVYREGERRARGELNLQEAAEELRVSTMRVLRWIREGRLPARQPCRGAPWIIRCADLEGVVPPAARTIGANGPLTLDSIQIALDFP